MADKVRETTATIEDTMAIEIEAEEVPNTESTTSTEPEVDTVHEPEHAVQLEVEVYVY